MTTNVSEQQSSTDQAKGETPRRTFWGWGLFALITMSVAVTAAAGAWYVWRDAEADRARLLRTLDEMTLQVAALEKLRENQAAITRHQDESATALASMASRMNDQEQELSRLANLIEGGRRHWQVIEVEQLLLIANDRMQLHHDLQGALHALTIANQRLADIAEPRLLETRKTLAEEISQLKAVPQVDTQSLVLQISALISRINDLPLSTDLPRNFENVALQQEAPVMHESGWRHLLDKMLQALNGMVQIRHAERPLVPLLPPEQEFFLRQNLKLKLETARLALLQRETATYRSALDTANGWLKAFFNTNDSAVTSAIEEITELGRQDLHWEAPDISGSLQALRRYMAVSGTGLGAKGMQTTGSDEQ